MDQLEALRKGISLSIDSRGTIEPLTKDTTGFGGTAPTDREDLEGTNCPSCGAAKKHWNATKAKAMD